MFNRNSTPTPLIGHGAISAGRRWQIGIALASGIVITAGVAMTALALRGQTTGNEGTLQALHCQHGTACTGTPFGIVDPCTGEDINNGARCYTSISYGIPGACTIPFPTGSCTFWQEPCYTYIQGTCAWQPSRPDEYSPFCGPSPGGYQVMRSQNLIATCR